jgi:hypothetical protein
MNVAASRAGRLACIAALAAAGLLTACSAPAAHPGANGSPASPSHAAQHPPSSPAAAPTTPGASQSTTPVSAPQPLAAGPGPCATGALHLAMGPANGTAGSIYYPLLLTNISAAACTLYGYPGVAFVTAPGGSVIGGPAVRNPTFPRELVTLAPGVTAHASLRVAIAANYPTSVCKPVTAHWLQVFPPGQYSALNVAFTAQTCTGAIPSGSTLGIYVVRPGATGP